MPDAGIRSGTLERAHLRTNIARSIAGSGEPWLWFSRLELDDAALSTIIHDPQVRIWAVLDRYGIEVGILELDFRESSQCEIAFSGWFPNWRARATANG